MGWENQDLGKEDREVFETQNPAQLLLNGVLHLDLAGPSVASEFAVASNTFQPTLIWFLIPLTARNLYCAIGEQALSNLLCF